jgi:mRNA-degrading endonuclease RelE of RelBE toxin-antitoxin system
VPYSIDFTPEAREHLDNLSAAQRSDLLAEVREQLVHQPDVETRNRKPLRTGSISAWELRVGKLRVYYDIVTADHLFVLIRGIGIKERSNVRFPGKGSQQ